MKKARKLRFHLLVPLVVMFFLLWAATMMFIDHICQEEAEQEVQTAELQIGSYISEQWDFYENNLKKGLGAEAARILTYNISGENWLLAQMEGGAAIGVRDQDGNVMQNQLSYGYGHEAGVDIGQRWHLDLDSGLDDEGQIALALWIMEHRQRGWNYEIWPSDSMGEGDGTIARITGQELPGYAIAVEKIELVHPDGTVEPMVETNHHAEPSITKEFRFLKVASNLVQQDWDRTTMEQYLEQFRLARSNLPKSVGGTSSNGCHLFNYASSDRSDAGYAIETWAATDQFVSQQNRSIHIFSFLLTLGAALLLATNLSLKILEPVEQLCRETKSGRCRENGSIQELNALAVSFNEAQDKLEAQLERERDFTRAAAHELKTPLAVLRTHTEALQEDILPEKRAHYLDVVLDETDRMSALVGSLLELSRLEAGTALTREWVDLKALTTEVFEPLALPFERKHMTLTVEFADVWTVGDRVRLKEAIGNLASNALRYGTEGGRVRVALTQEETELRLTVENDAPVIPETELPHLFEPFYRVDKARSRESGGTGLGLAIVKAAAEAHGGSCGAENLADGVRFWIALPVQINT